MKKLGLIDTHAHLDREDFEGDYSVLLERCQRGIFPKIGEKDLNQGIFPWEMKAIVLPGVTGESSRRGVQLAAESPQFLFPAVGIHPNHTSIPEDNRWEIIEELAKNPCVKGIGETGLDLYWDESPLDVQIDFLLRHIALAKTYDLPIIIHCREALHELMPILRAVKKEEAAAQKDDSMVQKDEAAGQTVQIEPNRVWVNGAFSADDAGSPRPVDSEFAMAGKTFALRGTIHAFSGDPETALECVELGFFLGFGGGVTYTNKKFAPVWEAAKVVPPERLLLETDSPFLIPHPFRGKLERNEPLMTAFVAKRLAQLRDVSSEEIIDQTTKNAIDLFRLPLKIDEKSISESAD